MPGSAEIVESLSRAANQWAGLAAAWHAVLGGAAFAAAAGWRVSERAITIGLALLMASVAAAGAASGNPFNSAVFVLAAAAVVWRRRRIGGFAAIRAGWMPVAGVMLVGFGWIYPHFVPDGGLAWLYEAPLGVLPCPSLAAAVGLAMIFSLGAAVSPWLGAVGIFYGAFGAFYLGVTIDVILLAGALALFVSTASTPTRARSAASAA